MNFDFSPKTASAAAKRLRAHLKREGIEIPHAKAVEAFARALNFENASAMRAALDAAPATQPAADTRPENQRPMLQGFRTPYPATPDVLVAARLAGGPERVARIRFATVDGVRRVVDPELDWTPDRVNQLEHALNALTRHEAGMSGYLLGVFREPDGAYRIVEALPVDRDRLQSTVSEELTRMLHPIGLVVGQENNSWVLMDDEASTRTTTEEDKLQSLYQHALLHDRTALRTFGFLLDNAPDYAESLLDSLRRNALRRRAIPTPDSTSIEALGLEVGHWMEMARRMRDELTEAPRARIEIDLSGEAPSSESVLIRTDTRAQRMALRPLAARADLLQRIAHGPAAIRACPLGFRILDKSANDSLVILEIAWMD